MNHPPFDAWPPPAKPLDAEAERALQNAWHEVEDLFQAAPEAAPLPGFSQRWLTNLQAEQAAARTLRYRWQSWIMLVLIANGAAFTLLLMGVQLFRTFDSFTSFVLFSVYRLTSTLYLASGLQNALATLLRTLPGLIPTGWWLGLALTLMTISAVWVLSVAKLASLSRRI